MDVDAVKVMDIKGGNSRFSSPFSDPCGYYIWAEEDETISDIDIQEYWKRLSYMSENMDMLVQQAFKPEFYNFPGIDKGLAVSPAEMCRQLVVDSFVLCADNKTTGCCLSNEQFMFGHFIDCLWSDSWELLYSYIC